MTTAHLAVWIDHQEARVLRLHEDDARFEEATVHSHGHKQHEKHGDGHRTKPPVELFHHVIEAMQSASHVVVMGPGSAKDELVAHVASHHAPLRARILGVLSSDHPSDRQIAHEARQFFVKHDHMKPVTRINAR